jgi:hypothetical protein
MNLIELFEPAELPFMGSKKFVNANKLTVDFIQEKCSQIIDIYQDTEKLLYRGYGGLVEKDIFISQSPINREPVDSSPTASEIFDLALQQDGIKALRSNSIFAVSKILRAVDYAKHHNQVFAIFPINSFDYCWNANDDDMVLTDLGMLRTLEIRPTFYSTNDETFKAAKTKLENEVYESSNKIKDEYAQKILDYFEPRNFDIRTAIMNAHEVWIHGSYIAIRNNKQDLIHQILA